MNIRDPLQPTIDALKPVHESMIDIILANPSVMKIELAKHFGYTPAWVSAITNSDAFQNRLAQRKTELVDPEIKKAIEANMDIVVQRSIGVIQSALGQPGAERVALDVIKAQGRAAKYGARTQPVKLTEAAVEKMQW